MLKPCYNKMGEIISNFNRSIDKRIGFKGNITSVMTLLDLTSVTGVIIVK